MSLDGCKTDSIRCGLSLHLLAHDFQKAGKTLKAIIITVFIVRISYLIVG